MARSRKTEVTIHRGHERAVTIPAHDVVAAPGLVVHKFHAFGEEVKGKGAAWHLTHHSGCLIRGGYRTKNDALAGGEKIADLADWTQEADFFRNNNELQKELYTCLAGW